MWVDEQLDDAPAEAKRSTRLRARPHHAARNSAGLWFPAQLLPNPGEARAIEMISRIGMRATGAFRALGAQSFSSAITRRATARYRSRWFTRATYSPLSNCPFMSVLPRARATHRAAASSHSSLNTSYCLNLPGVPKTRSVLGWLPETVNRVETPRLYF
jgi:hypothetical protein